MYTAAAFKETRGKQGDAVRLAGRWLGRLPHLAYRAGPPLHLVKHLSDYTKTVIHYSLFS
jgi:hypothetical protein